MNKDTLLTIPRPQKQCQNCGAQIDGLERHPSVIKVLQREDAERLDYCPQCWDYMKQEAWDSFWITHREPKSKRIPKLTRRQRAVALKALFESLWERRENEDVSPHLFLLAHLLMKWGGLKWKENRAGENGSEILVFEDPVSADQIEVESVDIDDERLAVIKEEIEEFLRQYAPDEEASL